jgi:hypothetical protein
VNATLHYDLVTILVTWLWLLSQFDARLCEYDQTVRCATPLLSDATTATMQPLQHHNIARINHSAMCPMYTDNNMTSIHAFNHSMNASMQCDQCIRSISLLFIYLYQTLEEKTLGAISARIVTS